MNDKVDKGTITISIYEPHNGHVPGSTSDVYHFQVHPDVISCCKDYLFDFGCASMWHG